MNKNKYERPIVSFINIETEDIITNSPGIGFFGEDDDLTGSIEA